MSNCVNFNSPDVVKLAGELNVSPVVAAAKIGVWQSKNNIEDRFPTVDELQQPNEVNTTLKAVDILQSDKAKQVFEKGKKAKWSLEKILTELQIPKDQKQLILDKDIKDREEIITSLLAENSFVVEVNTAKENKSQYAGENNFYISEGEFYGDYTVVQDLFSSEIEDYRKNGKSISKEGYLKAQEYSKNLQLTNTSHYSNLTVPGGTNYTENEIATPAITPSIKGHAQFATPNGIGWHRSDDRVIDIQQMLKSNLIKEVPCK